MSNFEQIEHNKKFIMRYTLIHHEGVTEAEIRVFTDNEAYLQGVLAGRRAFPDYTIHVEDITAEGVGNFSSFIKAGCSIYQALRLKNETIAQAVS